MKRFFKQLGSLFSAEPEATAAEPTLQAIIRKSPPPARHRSNLLVYREGESGQGTEPGDFDADTELGSWVQEADPGKSVLHDRRSVARADTLSIVESPEDGQAEDAGFDPYNTGQFDSSTNWSRHPRK